MINIGSTNGSDVERAAITPISKSALQRLVRGLSRDLAAGITINNVQSGPVDTGMNPANGEFAETLKGFMAPGAYRVVGEISGFVAYLVSSEAEHGAT